MSSTEQISLIYDVPWDADEEAAALAFVIVRDEEPVMWLMATFEAGRVRLEDRNGEPVPITASPLFHAMGELLVQLITWYEDIEKPHSTGDSGKEGGSK